MAIDTAALNPDVEADVLQSEGDESEVVPAPALSVGKRKIVTKSSDPEVESLYGKWKNGDLILQPAFQRRFVWDQSKASKLIESVLMSVPLPIIYLAQEPDGREYVIDGQQRLTSFFSFLDGKLPDNTVFGLRKLSVFPELEGKLYRDLPKPTQNAIRYYAIRTITILADSDPDLKFEIFERLNTGSVALNDMELRNCIYRGEYMLLLRELAAEPDFMALLGLDEPDKRMRDVELVLRFTSFYHSSYLHYQSPMKRFFNREMERYQHISRADAEELRVAFKTSVELVKALFGAPAFKRFHSGEDHDPNGSWETKRFNASLYDVMMGVLCRKPKNQIYAALDSIREGFIDLMSSNDEFRDAILLGTSEPGRVVKRFDLARLMVDDVLGTHRPQPRCFSRQLKRGLFEQNPVCALCGQIIQQIDDAAVDHVEQYWRGGQTIRDNARLTHRYCNNHRPRSD